MPCWGACSGVGNTLYVRDAGRLAERVRSVPRWTVRDAWWVGLQSDRGGSPSLGVFVGLKPDPHCTEGLVGLKPDPHCTEGLVGLKPDPHCTEGLVGLKTDKDISVHGAIKMLGLAKRVMARICQASTSIASG